MDKDLKRIQDIFITILIGTGCTFGSLLLGYASYKFAQSYILGH